ncbi:hypothetical protein [Clostridium perfringens]|uniref:hypothetical protein n=1 Tax=Clostridium perfringens TaxID=1502 RepID=UPI001ABA598B|nr:hypothetical protein [Clostridium perfringens]MBO3339859.1 hypothetical protein [Clostridium perfringens]MDK0581882.1 hypothetical protein [Clostridium perfringens]MDM0696514.1 hypothetical protein [Clostridium perfringens]MDM1008176.1 hypothetical protein [Clostridium perfringens]
MNLYESKNFKEFSKEILDKEKNTSFMHFCPKCGRETTFDSSKWFNERSANIRRYSSYLDKEKCYFHRTERVFNTSNNADYIGARIYIQEYECCVNRNHKLYNIYMCDNNIVTKIGQYPSSLDNGSVEYLKQLKEICSNKEAKEISKYIKDALVMESFGYGIASLLYIRRAFEKLIIISEGKEHENDGTTMKDRIKNNKYLPDLIKENSRIYNIISEGIHNQSEEECMELFKIIKVGVMILITRVYTHVEEEKELDKLKSLISSK